MSLITEHQVVLDLQGPDRHTATRTLAETLVADKRASSSRPGEGIVTLAHTARNQHGEVVATATRQTLVRLRPAEGADPGPRSPGRRS